MFYHDPNFWIFMSTFWGGIFGSIRLYFLYRDRSNREKASLDMNVENFKQDCAQRTLASMDEFMKRIEPMVLKHDGAMGRFEKALVMVGEIDKSLHGMSATLTEKTDDFNRKVVNVTVSFQTAIDKITLMETKLEKFGKVIKL